MVRRIILLMALASLLGAAATQAATAGEGKRGRNLARAMYYATQLKNDKLAVYEDYGYPVHRIRERCAGRTVERWTYYDLGLEVTFDETSTLVERRTFLPEPKRERIERFPEYRY